MNENWQIVAQVNLLNPLIPQAWHPHPISVAQVSSANPLDAIFTSLGISSNNPIFNLISAIAFLVVGWLVAIVTSNLTGSLFKQTNLDNRIAAWVTGRQNAGDSIETEKWLARIVFWLVMVFVLVGFLQALGLTAVATPFNAFLQQIARYIPSVGAAAILLGIAWLLATASRLLLLRALQTFNFEERISEQVSGSAEGEQQIGLNATLANALYWFIFLLFLPLVLETLELKQALTPVQNLVDQFLAALPRIIKAIAIGGVGWLLAQVVRRLVTNLLAAMGIDRLGGQVGIARSPGSNSFSGAIGTIAYVLVLIPTAVSALDALEIKAVSAPAIAMLNRALETLPQIFVASLILVVAYYAGQFINQLITSILTGIGFNNIFYVLGLQSAPQPVDSQTSVEVVEVVEVTEQGFDPVTEPTSTSTSLNAPLALTSRTPSELIGILALIAVMLFAAIAATNILQIPALSSLVTGILVTSSQVLGGLLVFAIGLYLANLVFNLVSSAGTRQSRILGHTARICVIALAAAMGLQQMGIATNIVNLAFGLLLGAIAVAIAIAFGLGGRDIAAEQIREWLSSFKRNY